MLRRWGDQKYLPIDPDTKVLKTLARTMQRVEERYKHRQEGYFF